MRSLMPVLAAIALAAGTARAQTGTSTTTSQTHTSKPGAARPGTARAKSTTAPKAAANTPMTDDQKIVYALGLSIARSINQFDLSPGELDVLKKALTDAQAGKPALELQEWGPKIQGLAQSRGARVAEREKQSSKAYLDKAASEPGAVKTPSGLIYKELKPGTGPSPKPSDTVRVNYRGTLINGTEFDSSYKRNQPAEFALNKVIPCWTEGVQKMKVGEKAMLVCPSSLAYGDNGNASIPGGATLIFEVELLAIPGATP